MTERSAQLSGSLVEANKRAERVRFRSVRGTYCAQAARAGNVRRRGLAVREGYMYDIGAEDSLCPGTEGRAASIHAELGDEPLPGVDDRLAYRIAKRAFDVAFSAGVLAALLIPGTLLGVAICLESPGGPMFRQKRIGRGGREIRIFKFRSMYSDAHDNPEKYLNKAQMAQWRREQKVDNDPRVTPLGRLIRKMSLDEVPQFINVLAGDMSVIGPRPVTLEETYEFGEDRDEVLSVRPGITGWWQVKSRNDATWESGERQRLELEYVRNQSIAMDVRVFLGTFGVMFGKNKSGR